ncbi:MAG: ABC transporter permease [Parachlamydiales bacterium]
MLQFELRGALRTLSLRPLQTLLSALGVLVGVAAVVAMLSVGEGAKRRTLKEIEQLGLSNVLVQANARSPLTTRDLEHIERSLPMVQAVLPIKSGQIRGMAVVATDPRAEGILNLRLLSGRFLTSLDTDHHRPVCVIGSDLARALGRPRELLLGKTSYTVVGILESSTTLVGPAEKLIWIPIGTGFATRQGLSDLIVHLRPGADLHLAQRQLDHLLTRAHPKGEYQVIIPSDVLRQQRRAQQTFNAVLAAVAVVSLLVGGIGVANVMLANLVTRIREIGIRRAIGATRRHIFQQFLAETLLLTLGGALSGLLLGILIALMIGLFAGWETAITGWSCLLALALSIGVGLLSGLYPATRAARLSPVTALSR